MTPYELNVNSLFTCLMDSASVSNFNKFEISPPISNSQNDVVYGLFQCRGDLSSSNCRECVVNSISQLKKSCHLSTGGTIQLDGCFVKYGNSSFFGVVDKMEVLKRCGSSIGYNSDVLSRIDNALARLVAGNGQYFRGGDFGSIQGVAQCLQDLSVSDCQECLLEASGRLRSECETSSWGDMYLGKCYIRYADQDNGNSSYSNGDNQHGGEENSNSISKLIGYIVAALVGGGLAITATISIKNCCNINVMKKITKIKKGLEGVAETAKTVTKDMEAVKKDIETVRKESQSANTEGKLPNDNASNFRSHCDGMPMPNYCLCDYNYYYPWCQCRGVH